MSDRINLIHPVRHPPTGYERLSFNPYLVRLFVVKRIRKYIKPHAEEGQRSPKRVWISGSETLIRPFHVFNFHWLLHGNGRGQLKETMFLTNKSCSAHVSAIVLLIFLFSCVLHTSEKPGQRQCYSARKFSLSKRYKFELWHRIYTEWLIEEDMPSWW